MDLKEFQDRCDSILTGLRQFITDNVKSTGNKECDCQQLAILNRLSALERALNGTEQSDITTA